MTVTGADLLQDAYGRIKEAVHGAVSGLSVDDLHVRLDDAANPIAWLIWHLTRVQDDHIADAAGTEQVWTAQGFSGRFNLDLPVESIGFRHSNADVAAVRVNSAQLLTDYHDAVHAVTDRYVSALGDSDLDRVIDDNWTPHVTLGVRLVSVIGDCMQHVGQAEYVQGILQRR